MELSSNDRQDISTIESATKKKPDKPARSQKPSGVQRQISVKIDKWNNIQGALYTFQTILASKKIPTNFAYIFKLSLHNEECFKEMNSCGALIHWNEKENSFSSPWTLVTIQEAVDAITRAGVGVNDKHEFGSADLALNSSALPSKLQQTAPTAPPKPKQRLLTKKSIPDSDANRTEGKTPESTSRVNCHRPQISFEQHLAFAVLHEDQMKVKSMKENFKKEYGKSLSTSDTQIDVIDRWQSLAGKSLRVLDQEEYVKVRLIPTTPQLHRNDIEAIATILPYIIHKVKSWGCHVLRPEHLQNLYISEATVKKPTFGRISLKKSLDTSVIGSNSLQSETSNVRKTAVLPLSRIDVLTCLVANTDILILQDIFRIMSQFPVALPLIVQNISRTTESSPLSEGNKYKLLTSGFHNCLIKWQGKEEGTIIENSLFRSPFILVVALRVGVNIRGKSTIINQLMSTPNMFSSRAESGGEFGVPFSLRGTVEFTWLTQETCKSVLWEGLKCHYMGLDEETFNSNHIILLANLHGDASEFPETLQLLSQIATSFIIFYMPDVHDNLEMQQQNLSTHLGTNDNVVEIIVDPINKFSFQEGTVIETSTLTDDITLKNMTEILQWAIGCKPQPTIDCLANYNFSKCSTIIPSQQILTNSSKKLMGFVSGIGCRSVRETFQLQKKQKRNFEEYREIWRNDANLQHIVSLFLAVLNLPIEQRRIALAHLDSEISVLSANASNEAYQTILKLKDSKKFVHEYSGSFKFPSGSASSPDKIKNGAYKGFLDKIKAAYVELDKSALGLEHFFREIGRVYELALVDTTNPIISSVRILPEKYAELLIDGTTIEVLDGDLGDVSGLWLDAICHQVCRKLGELKVFIVSILGLQSSGKSTLLNALFGCKFAVSVGRCTRGLFMRLLFLEEKFRREFQVDAILLIDTEGLGAPEKINDADAEKKDRLMATFAMSISNLTLINILGESKKEMTDILQIVIVTLARLEKADIAPDILLVQHLAEKNHSKTARGVDEFCLALQAAIDVVDKQEMELGVRNCRNLEKLEESVRAGHILIQFGTFKNGATPHAPPSEEYHRNVEGLHSRIMNICKLSVGNRVLFHDWHELLRSYWTAIQTQDFALRFKNIKEIHDFIDRGTQIAKVKQAVDLTFRGHQKALKIYLQSEVYILTTAKVSAETNDETQHRVEDTISAVLARVPEACDAVILEWGHESCKRCTQAKLLIDSLFERVYGKEYQHDTEMSINSYIETLRKYEYEQLLQLFEAMKVHQGNNSVVDTVIENALTEELEDTAENKSDFSTQDRAERVWKRAETVISTKYSVAPFKERLISDVLTEYSNDPIDIDRMVILINTSSSEEQQLLLLNLRTCEAFKGGFKAGLSKLVKRQSLKKNIAVPEALWLEDRLDRIPKQMLDQRKVDHYENGMVEEHKVEVQKILQKFESKFGNLLPDFKWKVRLYALKVFGDYMENIQNKWNRKNLPLFMVQNKKDHFVKQISVRLQPGSLARQGRDIAMQLLTALQRTAKDVGDRDILDAVLQQRWIQNPENIRLRYFTMLATEVEQGEKRRALQHFSHPKNGITDWFKIEVDACVGRDSINNAQKMYTMAVNNLLQVIQSKLTVSDILQSAENYFHQATGMRLKHSIDLNEKTESDAALLRKNITETLTEKQSVYFNKVQFKKPSEHQTIFYKLGCTAHCTWCGALCWGHKSHENDFGITNKHHSCHQPRGLIGSYDLNSEELITSTCVVPITEKEKVAKPGEESQGYAFGEDNDAREFSYWIYAKHPKDQFDELMHWFFVKLNKDLAKLYQVKQASPLQLKLGGFNGLESKLDQILATMYIRLS